MIIDDQLFYNLVFNFEMQKLASTDDQLRANSKLIDRLIFEGFYLISYPNLTRVYLFRQITHSGRQMFKVDLNRDILADEGTLCYADVLLTILLLVVVDVDVDVDVDVEAAF